MCGIIGRIGPGEASEELLNGLENLEYRGYDSAGVATRCSEGIDLLKRGGEIVELAGAIETKPPRGSIGIGHTRWSTHGPPTDENAHPHTDCSGRVAVVHNGIIDNYMALREQLESGGHEFTSETDTEVIPHLIERHLAEGDRPETAFRRAIDELEGGYAIVAVIEGFDGLFGARSGSPLLLGVGEGRYYLASDVPAFLDYTDSVVYLHDNDLIEVRPSGYTITNGTSETVERTVETVDWDPGDAGKGGYDHYMLKEIHEQPSALRQTIRGRTDSLAGRAELADFPPGHFAGVTNVHLVAMGTSYHAAMYAELLLGERGVPARAVMAGEYATCPPPITDGTLVIAISQSGETADTLSAIRRIQGRGTPTLAVTNVVGSTITRECTDSLYIRAGPEIGVAATKSFSSQVAALTLLAERIGEDTDGTHPRDASDLFAALGRLPDDLQRILDDSRAADVARRYADSQTYFFIGRGLGHPVAKEGALKFKEITYDHAEGFSAAELKHGPLALVTQESPVFAVFCGRDDTKTLHNVKEVRARGAPVIGVGPPTDNMIEHVDDVLAVPETHQDLVGILANVQLQLVSYYAAEQLSRSIDKPRNLAKSVTVE